MFQRVSTALHVGISLANRLKTMSGKHLLHQEIILDINADVAEFCPVAGHLQWLAVGAYELNEARKQRHGRLHLYSLATSSSSANIGQPCLQLSASLDLPGIFDLQWTQLPILQRQPCIGLALADGSLQLLAVAARDDGERQNGAERHAQDSPKQQVQGVSAELQQLCSSQAVSEGMALALDWNQHAAAPLAAVSSSSGSISVLQVRLGRVLVCLWCSRQHGKFDASRRALQLPASACPSSAGDAHCYHEAIGVAGA